jgi:hypothetical protein
MGPGYDGLAVRLARLLTPLLALALLAVPASAGAAAPPTGVFVGKVGRVAFAAALDSRGVVVYACDGRRLGSWFKGAVGNRSRLSLRAGRQRLTLLGRRAGASAARDRIVVRFARRRAVLSRARGRQGLYRSENLASGRKRLGGWIVLPGGRQVGVVANGTQLAPAPTLSTASLTAGGLIAGTVVAPSDPQSLVMDFDGDGIDVSGTVTTRLLGGGSRTVNWTRAGDDDVFIAFDTAKLRDRGIAVNQTGGVLARGGLTITRGGVSTTTTNGFHMLRLLNGNGDNILSPADPAFEAGQLFRDTNGNGNFGDSNLNGSDLVAEMAAMNMEFLALQEATQNESRRFTALSNASRARHATAVNAIRNLK